MKPAVLVRRFYDDLWTRGDETVAAEILAGDLRFRGSLGQEAQGRDGFLDYLRMVRGALADYTCRIDGLVVDGDHAAARMTFRGRHTGPFLGVAPSGRTIEWAGAAFFTCRDGRIGDIWVLGDVDAVKRQLSGQRGA